jgi:hypothetical protein
MPNFFEEEDDISQKMKHRLVQILLHVDAANLLFVGSPDCVLPDASGKFFAHF